MLLIIFIIRFNYRRNECKTKRLQDRSKSNEFIYEKQLTNRRFKN